MSNSQFLDTNFNGGLQAPHYFNGRLLTAEDLKTDQQAVLTREAWLGQASGYGVIEGLIVSQVDSTSLKVAAGLGLNRQGQVIHLPSDTTLQLFLQAANNAPIDDAGHFKNCDFSAIGGGNTVVSDGAYLLTVIPASRLDGLAPMKAAAGSTAPPGCASKSEIEGLQFKAIRLTAFEAEVTDITDINRQNLLAHWCYGSKHLPDLARDPFHFSSNFGGLDGLDLADLTLCDLPLAVFYWLNGTLVFVDAWSARRRLIRPDALDETQDSVVVGGGFSFPRLRERFAFVGAATMFSPSAFLSRSLIQHKTRTWKGILSDKRVAEGQARFLQFQAQIDSLIATGKIRQVDARDYFPFMPPAGFLPVSLPSLEAAFRQELKLASAPWLAAGTAPVAAPSAQPVVGHVALAESQPSPTVAHLSASLSNTVAASVLSSFATGTHVSPELLALHNQNLAVANQVQQLQSQIDTLTKQVQELGAQAGANRPPAAHKSGNRKLQRRERHFLQELDALLQPRRQLQGLGGTRVNNGFNLLNFFSQLPIHIGLIDRETVDFLIQRSWYDEAVDLSTVSQLTYNLNEGITVGGGTTGRSSRRNVVAPLFEIYIVLENLTSTQDQLYILFTKVVRPTTWLHPFEKIRG